MGTSVSQLEAWMQADSEDEHLEFKEAKSNYDFEKLVHYCVALANERGGKMILGVTDRKPRRVVGSSAFSTLERTKAGLFEALHLRTDAEEIAHPDGRVIVFHVPPRPLGKALEYKGTYYMRIGEELRGMTWEQLDAIARETTPDFSGETRAGADLSHLAPAAIQVLRDKWSAKSGNRRYQQLDDLALLQAANLAVGARLTNAALILMGTASSLRRFQLGQAEVIFEYRNDPDAIGYDDRENFQDGFLLCADQIWEKINLRNEVHQIQEGLFRRDIRSFNERVVREALLNAVTHRDYGVADSVFIKQSARRLSVESPGGFLPGITPENVRGKHVSRNRLIAEVFEKCGYVERSGQGVDLMFEESIRDSKLPPDYTGSNDYSVQLTLWGEVQDESFVRFVEKVDRENQAGLHTEDYVLLDLIRREQRIPQDLKPRLKVLRGLGVVEAVGQRKGTRYILSRRYYEFIGRAGTYTRTKGLDRDTNKELIVKHISSNARRGSCLQELNGVLPSFTRSQIQSLLRELKAARRVHVVGRTRGARWYPGSAPDAE